MRGRNRGEIMLKYHLAITVIMRNRFVKKEERLNQLKKTNLQSLPQVPVTAMHSKANISNNLAIMDIKSLSSTSQKLDVAVLPSEKKINCEINQILRVVESMKVSMNGLTSLIREVIQRLDVLEKNSVSLKMQSVLDEDNTLVGVFPIKIVASLKEVENKIENNSAFKEKLIISLTQVSSTDIKKTVIFCITL